MGKNRKFLDQLISELEPDHVPEEFVSYAKVTNHSGDVSILTNDEFLDLISDPENLEENDVLDIQLILDLDSVKEAIEFYSEIILNGVPE